ncbi:MAG: cytochrome c biogenesis protein ResB [Spirochaetes bacterium]|nr:cytochrome c biogenesis protein ResB [Spirochaetota bacterium]
MIKKIIKAIASIYLGIGIIITIICFSIIASLIIQNQKPEFYYYHYSHLATQLILRLNLHQFFTSPLFLILAVGLFINLVSCTIIRIMKQIRNTHIKPHLGPDIIHLGLLIILMGGLVSLFSRNEEFQYFYEKEKVKFSKKYYLEINQIEFSQYSDGRPKEYVTNVTVYNIHNHQVIKQHRIEVNKPLRMGNIYVYQYDLQIDPNKKVPGTSTSHQRVLVTGLNFVQDSGIYLLWVGIMLMIVGLCWTYFQKFKEKQL